MVIIAQQNRKQKRLKDNEQMDTNKIIRNAELIVSMLPVFARKDFSALIDLAKELLRQNVELVRDNERLQVKEKFVAAKDLP